MKSEFDLNNLTDEDVQILEEALSRRRLMKLCCDEFNKDYAQRCLSAAISAGFKPGEIHTLVAPNYGNINRSVFTHYRQSGKNPENDLYRMNELLMQLKPFSEYLEDLEDFEIDQIDEDHEQYNAVFNQFRSSKYLPKIELKIGSLYELKLGEIIKQLHLVRIDGNIKHFPELYFSENVESSIGTNISVYKIIKEIKCLMI